MISPLINRFKNEKTPEEIKQKKGYNPNFLSAIQPQGGISFHESYIRKGDGYETVIQIYDYPVHVNDFWLEKILNMKNAITTIDVATTPRSEVIATMNQSLTEQSNRTHSEKNNTGKIDASNELDSLQNLYNEISQLGEVMKFIHIRFYVSGKTIKDLEENVKEVLEELEGYGFRGSIFLNEQEYEWKALFSSFSEQKKFPNKRDGKGLSSYALAGGYPFHFTQLNDPNGTYLGQTFTGGNVLFDLFHKDKRRRYYNAVAAGTMGAGKSTLLKKLKLDNTIRSNIIRGIDVTGEFATLCLELNGRLIPLDGSQGIINPLQVLKIGDNEHQSFMQHLSKLSTFYRFLAPDSKDEDIKEFERMLRKLYIDHGLVQQTDKDYSDVTTYANITHLNAKDYPIFSDFLLIIQKELYSDLTTKSIRETLTPSRVIRLEKIELTLINIVENYGYLFNDYSSIEDITEEQVVIFSVRNLTSLKPEVFNAQMFNVLTLLWDNMLKNGKPQWDAYEYNRISWEDIVRYLIFIDESHRIINPQNMLAVKYLIEFAREARKYFGGLVFASQSIRDFVPEGSDLDVVSAIKTLFELTQYKFIMQQDAASLNVMREIFDGQLSESELASIPYLSQGECILAINGGVGNISFRVDPSEEELRIFHGGA